VIKLQAVTAYLIARQWVAPEQLASDTEQADLSLVWKLGTDGLHMGDMRYRAVISFERFAGNPVRLMALVGTWLENNDPGRDRYELAAPTFSVEPLDNDLFDVDLVLDFVEPQHLTEDAGGEFGVFGRTWALMPYELWVAEQGEVSSRGR